ncbi:MAG: RNA polymerase subunit sigma, partial [Hoeflea sp.]|nr:RNA polymerase subunit sigma [Hoeflea sp.]
AAEIAGVAVGTIKSRVNRARNRLRELLGIDGEGDYGPDSTSAPLVNKGSAGM